MKCFTITDRGDGSDCVEEGVIVSETEALIDLTSDVVTVKNTRPSVAIGMGRSVARVPVSAEHAAVFQVAKATLGCNALKLKTADVVEDEQGDVPMLIKEKSECPWLLVHVALAAGVGGRLWFEDVLPERTFDGWAVRTAPGPFPVPGVKVLAFGVGPQGEPQALIKMARGAGFRVKRTGNLDGLPPVIEVRYKKKLEAKPPAPKR
jgi:hypothetical protein